MNIFQREPAAVIGAVCAVVTAIAAFVPAMTPERLAAVNAVIVAVGTVLTRSQVASVAALEALDPTKQD